MFKEPVNPEFLLYDHEPVWCGSVPDFPFQKKYPHGPNDKALYDVGLNERFEDDRNDSSKMFNITTVTLPFAVHGHIVHKQMNRLGIDGMVIFSVLLEGQEQRKVMSTTTTEMGFGSPVVGTPNYDPMAGHYGRV